MPDRYETGQYFDRRAEDLHRDNLVDKGAAVAPLLAGLRPGAHVVECGAGTGLYTLPLLRAGYQVTAIDLSASSLAQLEKAAEEAGCSERLATARGDFLEVVGELHDVDAVTFIKVLHHFPDQPSIARAIRHGWSSLGSGGCIVIFEPNGASPMWPVLFRLRGREVWEAERNTRLIRHDFLHHVLVGLPAATVASGYRYLVPGTFTVRRPWLDRIDRRLCGVPGLRAMAGNVWLTASR